MSFWDKQVAFPDIYFKKSSALFIEKTESIIHYRPDDIVLDIGCGPGFLAHFLKERTSEIHCADTSVRNIEKCKSRFFGDKRIRSHEIDRSCYTDLSFLPKEKKFSLIICQSVVQYYDDIRDVEELIRNVGKIASPGARFLIADLPYQSSLVGDVITQLWEGLQHR
ncbi:MAG: class I SAM-dependent methyltransferase [Deltaproteobacteria bacterium]|nr:class I SAM-dependent methyltransferase [Deltaproteobacteria bacterium]